MPFEWAHPRAAARLVLGRSVVLVTVGGVRYAVEAGRVRHLLEAGARPAGDEVEFEGRGWPLVRLRALFGLPPAEPRRLVLVEDGEGHRGALVADQVLHLARLDEAGVVPLPAVYTGRERRWFAALARHGAGVVVLLDVAGVLAEARARAGGPVGMAV